MSALFIGIRLPVARFLRVGCLVVGVISSSAFAVPTQATGELASSRLLAAMLEAALPGTLYQEQGVQWLGGHRQITLTKAGPISVSSTAQTITVQFPVRVKFSGNINTQIFMLPVKAACHAQFTAPSAVTFELNRAQKIRVANVAVTLTVPPVMAHCEGYQIPIAALLSAVIQQQKPQWQQDIQQRINQHLAAAGV